MRSSAVLVRALATPLLLAACGGPEPTGPPPVLEALPRQLTSSERALITASNGFAFGLLREVNARWEHRNVFISPLSASMALGMTMNGAVGPTFDGMRHALAFDGLAESEIDSSYRSLIGLLRSLDPTTRFRIANSIWHERTFQVEPAFVDATRRWFDASVTGADFADPRTVERINRWASDNTEGKIPKVLEDIAGDQVMFLINAIYFKGVWRQAFDRTRTSEEPFILAGGGTRPVRLMRLDASLPYYEAADYQAVDLPYGNGAYTMTVLLPAIGTSADALAASLTPQRWDTLAALLAARSVDLALPALRLTWEDTLNGPLSALGMEQAFSDSADFSRISRGGGLSISFVKQNTFVDIYEEGTEAAAVTTVGIELTSAPPAPIVVRVDRPYLFAIRERLTGTILFLGKIAAPPER